MAIYELKGHELNIVSFIEDWEEEHGKGAKLPPIMHLEKMLDLDMGNWSRTVRKLVDRKILIKHGSGRYSVTDKRCYVAPKPTPGPGEPAYKPCARAMYRPKAIQDKEHSYWMDKTFKDWVKDGILIFS